MDENSSSEGTFLLPPGLTLHKGKSVLEGTRAPLSTTPPPEGETEALGGARTGPKPHGLGVLFSFPSLLPSPPAPAQPPLPTMGLPLSLACQGLVCHLF